MNCFGENVHSLNIRAEISLTNSHLLIDKNRQCQHKNCSKKYEGNVDLQLPSDTRTNNETNLQKYRTLLINIHHAIYKISINL